MCDATREAFRLDYEARLLAAVRANPDKYYYTESEVPKVAQKMTDALARGNASLSPVIKAICKELNVKPTMRDISAYLLRPPQ